MRFPGSGLPASLIALALVVSACSAAGTPETTPAGDIDAPVTLETTTTTTSTPVPETTRPTEPEGVTALEAAFTTGLANDDPAYPPPGIDVDQLVFGLRAPDLIPAIDDPSSSPAAELTEWLTPQEAVVVVAVNGDVRGYPVRVLMRHEIVNDVIGGVPVAVTYCPLCNSALSFVRTIDGAETTFGVSGMLFNSALVMYDRLTQSLWLHFTGEAVVGHLAGRSLERIPTSLLSFGEFLDAHPDAPVLDPPVRTSYGANPYVGYDRVGTDPFLFFGVVDPRAEAKKRVVGVVDGDTAAAWTTDSLIGGEATVTTGEVGGLPVVIFWSAGQVSALDGARVEDGAAVGSVGVFRPVAGGSATTFSVVGSAFVDEATGTTWNVLGEAIDGPLAGERLERVPHLDTFWFAWSAYQPHTDLVTVSGTIPAP